MCYWKIATKALSKISSCCPATTGTCGAGGSNQRDLLRLPESALVAGTVAVPAFAQSPPAGNATSSPATHHTRAPMGTPSERNAALTDEGLVRASKLVGPSVYNYHDEKMAVLRRYPWKGEHGR